MIMSTALTNVKDRDESSRRLSGSQYAKTIFRARQASLSYPEKVTQVVEMQCRLVPICAARGQKIVPWKKFEKRRVFNHSW